MSYESPEEKLVKNTAKVMQDHAATTRLRLERLKALKASFLSSTSKNNVVDEESVVNNDFSTRKRI